jgi:hypothetical protein
MSPFTPIYVYWRWFLFITPFRNMGLSNQFNLGLDDATGEVSERVRSAVCTPVIVIHSEHRWCEQYQKFIPQKLNCMQKWNLLQREMNSIECCGTLAEFNVRSACIKVILCFLPDTFQHSPAKIPNSILYSLLRVVKHKHKHWKNHKRNWCRKILNI